MEKKKQKKSFWKRAITGVSLFILALIAVVGITFAVISWWVLPSKRLTPIVLKVAQKYIDADLQAERINLVFRRTFPNIGVRIDQGLITTHNDTIGDEIQIVKDTLLEFQRIIVAINVMDYLKKKRISVPFMAVDSLSLFARVDEDGNPNWNIFKNDTVIPTDTSTISASSPSLNLRLRNLWIRGLYLQYDDEKEGTSYALYPINAHIKTAIKDTVAYLLTEAELGGMEYSNENSHFSFQQKMKLKTRLKATDNYSSFYLRESTLNFGGLDLMLSGKIQASSEKENTYFCDLQTNLNTSDIPQLLRSLPQGETLLPFQVKKGTCHFSGKFTSLLSRDCVPFVECSCSIEEGEVNLDKNLPDIKNISLDFNLHIDSSKEGKSYAKIHKIQAQMGKNNLFAEATVEDLLKDRKAKGNIKAHLNLDSLANMYALPNYIEMGGKLDANMNFSFTQEDLSQANYGNIRAEGMMNIDKLLYKNPLDSIDLYIHQVNLSLKNPQLKHVKNRRGFVGELKADSLSAEYGKKYNAKIKQAEVDFFTVPSTSPADSANVIPLFAKADLKRMLLKSGDSLAIISRHTHGDFKMFPSRKDKKSPIMHAALVMDTFLIGAPMGGSFFSHASLSANLQKHERKIFPKSQTPSRKTRKRPIQKGLNGNHSNRSMLNDKKDSLFFAKWDLKGDLEIGKMRLRSKFFPLRVALSDAKMTYSSNDVHLTQAHLKVGRSQTNFSGDIEKLRAALLHGRKLNAKLRVDADSIHLNELVSAISKSMSLASQKAKTSSSGKEKHAQISMETLSEDSLVSTLYDIKESTQDSTVLTLPEYLNFELNSRIKWLGYGKGEMTKLKGNIKIKNGSMQFTNLGMDSRYGEGMLSLIYSPISTKSAFTGFDLELKKIQVERLFDLYPPIDSMLPMLKSVEGVVDCKLAVTATLDSCMNLEIPSLNAACKMHGEQLVLLDGETFAEISKKLFFKNKKRNLIDSMSVQFVVKDNKIAIFPFILSIDRYKTAIAGVQGLDMNFKYHISLLKSPIPFKMGVDVAGNLNKYKIKLTKAKLKENRVASTYNLVEDVRINLKKEIAARLEVVGKSTNQRFSLLRRSEDTLSNHLIQTLDSVAPDLTPSEDSLLKKSENNQ